MGSPLWSGEGEALELPGWAPNHADGRRKGVASSLGSRRGLKLTATLQSPVGWAE